VHVELITRITSFLALAEPWNALMRRATVDHPFCAFDWMRSWWEAFGDGHELHLVVARRGGQVCAIAPLMLTRGRFLGVPIRRLESMTNTETPRFDFIVDRDDPDGLAAIWRFLQRDAPNWDLLQLAQLPADGPTMVGSRRLIGHTRWPIGEWKGDESPYVAFPTDGEEIYERAIGHKHRANVSRLLRRLLERQTVELELVTRTGALQAALADGLRLEASGWKTNAGTAIVSQPSVERFYRCVAARFAMAGQLQLTFLKSGDQRIAFAYGIRRGSVFYMLKCGYDPAFARFAPMHVLCHLLFRNKGGRDLSVVDFLGRNDEWKRRWTHRTKRHVWLYVFRNAWWTRLLCRTKFELVPHLKQKAVARAVTAMLRERAERRQPDRFQPTEG
jgi:CelD/BcsL family acetyltransferase involved in cellulose biosynthesis